MKVLATGVNSLVLQAILDRDLRSVADFISQLEG